MMSPALHPSGVTVVFFTSDRKTFISEPLLLGQIGAKLPLGEDSGLLDSLNDAGLGLVGKWEDLLSITGDDVEGRYDLWLTRLLGRGARGTGDSTCGC
jgi:hypothetical protein